jgi:hypothetical protein
MPIRAVLSIDGGQTLSDNTMFEARPEVGEMISFWKDGREPLQAVIKSLSHQQVEGGYVLIVEAETDEVERWVASYRPSI